MPIYYKVIHGETIDKRKFKPFYIENISDSTGYFYYGGRNSQNLMPELTFSYSKDNIEWTTMVARKGYESDMIYLEPGEKLYLKKSASGYYNYANYRSIRCSFDCKIAGNIMSMVYGDDFTGYETNLTITLPYLFIDNTHIIDASNLILPATELLNSCYIYMFSGCSSLTRAPELPATILTDQCYNNMFSGCSSLTQAPDLLATDIKLGSYTDMFSGCSLLNNVKCLAKTGVNSYTMGWLNGVSSTGVFTKASGVNWVTGTNGIPEGWTVEEI